MNLECKIKEMPLKWRQLNFQFDGSKNADTKAYKHEQNDNPGLHANVSTAQKY